MPFQDIKGHDNITYFFKKALKAERISHAYLFAGPDGVGKTLFAHVLSKALNCTTLADDACDKCDSCVKIDNRNHPDIYWIKSEKDTIPIESIRKMQGQTQLKPYEGRTKVFIIENSHAMTPDAANCLLKTLEEPPQNCVIILITSKPEQLPLTVRSRCKEIKFAALDLRLKIELLQVRGVPKEEAIFISRLANSGIKISEERVTQKQQELFAYRDRILAEFRPDKGFGLVDEKSFIFKEPKEKLFFIISMLEAWFRDILVLKTDNNSIVINSDRIRDLEVLKERFSFADLEAILKEIEKTLFGINRNVGPRLALNNLKMKISERRV